MRLAPHAGQYYRAMSLGPPEVRQALAKHLGAAAKALHAATLDDERVHSARKSLKRARSGLQLLRAAMDPQAFERERQRLRRAAIQLASVRDDKVLIDVVQRLLEDEKHPRRRAVLQRAKEALRAQRRAHWRALQRAGTLHYLERALNEASRRVQGGRLAAADAGKLEQAVRRLFRKGRRALAASVKKPSDQRLHEARKKVKHLAHAVEILAGLAQAKALKKALRRMAAMGDELGEDHDLAVLEARLNALEVPAKPKRKLRKAIDKRRRRLQKKALRRGGSVFRKKTKAALAAAVLEAG